MRTEFVLGLLAFGASALPATPKNKTAVLSKSTTTAIAKSDHKILPTLLPHGPDTTFPFQSIETAVTSTITVITSTTTTKHKFLTATVHPNVTTTTTATITTSSAATIPALAFPPVVVPGPGPTPNCCGQAKCAGEHRCYGHPHAHYHKKPHHHKQPAISGLWRTLEWVLGKVFSKLRKAKVQYQGLQTFPPESKCGGRCRVHLTPKCGKKCRTSLALAKNATSLVDVTPQPTPACDGMCQPTGTCHKHCQERKQSAGNCPPWRTNMTEIAEEGARLGNAGARESAKFATAEGATWGQNWASMTATRVERGGTPCNETDFTVVPFGNPVHCADGVRNIINAGKPNATIITKSTSNAPLSAKELEEYDRYLEHEKQWMEIIRKRSWLIPDIPWRRSVDGNGTAARNGTAPPSEEEKKAFETIVVTYILAVLKPDGTNLNSTIDTILQFAKDHPQEFGKRENRGPFVHVKAANGTEKVVAIHGQRERMIESVVQVEEVRKTVVKTAEPAVRTVSDVVTVTSTRVTEAVRTAAV